MLSLARIARIGGGRITSAGNFMPRVGGLDFIRAWAVIFVLSVHFLMNTAFYTSPLSGVSMFIQTALRWLFLTCVPLFLLLSGYLQWRKTPERAYFKKISFVIGVYLFFGVAAALFKVFVQGEGGGFEYWVWSICTFSVIGYGWYVRMYIGLFLLAPFLNILYHALPDRRGKEGLLLIVLLVTGVPGLLNGWGLQNFIMPDWWVGIYPVTYYLLGVYLREFQPKIKKSLGAGLALGIILAESAITMWASDGGPFKAVFGYYDSIAVMGLAVLLFITCYDLEIKNQRVNAACQLLSRFSLDIYLCSYITDTFFYPRLSALYAGGWTGWGEVLNKPLAAPFAIPQAEIFPFILIIVPCSICVCLLFARAREAASGLLNRAAAAVHLPSVRK